MAIVVIGLVSCDTLMTCDHQSLKQDTCLGEGVIWHRETISAVSHLTVTFHHRARVNSEVLQDREADEHLFAC